MKNPDQFGYDRVATLRKKIPKQIAYSGFGKLTPQQAQMLDRSAEYADFRRVENERQLEQLKNHLATFIYNRDLNIRGKPEGGTRVIEFSAYDAMIKATRFYLEAMDIQNKMWGIYEPRPESGGMPSASGPMNQMNIKNVSVAIVQELQKLAKNPNGARIVDAE